MHPQVNVPKPGKCPICATDLVARLPEPAVREVISSFIEAAARNDRAAAARFLSKCSQHVLEHTREIMLAGMEMAKISCVVVAHGRALAATNFAHVPDTQQRSAMCVVYTVVKERDRWVVDNIDLADAEGLSEEISDLQAMADPPASSQPADRLTDTSVEQKVRDVIAKFAEAAVNGDKEAVSECLHPKMHGLLDEVAESASAGLKLGEIRSVIVRGNRALVATEMAPISSRKSPTRACTVYTLVKVGESWLIEDVDMEDENGLAQEIGRFQGKSPVAVEEQMQPT